MLETQDLILRRGVFEDWKAMYENVWRHPETARYMLWDVTTSEEEAMARMERTLRWQTEHYAWFVEEKHTGNCIGFAGFIEVDPGVYEDTGVALGPDYVGRGYGKQVLRALLTVVFDRLDGQVFIGSARSENAASIALQRSCGFVYTHSESRTDPRNGEHYTLNFYEKRRDT